MTVRDRVRGWMDRWSAAQADRMLLRWAPPIRRDVAKLRWAYEHGTDRGRNAYQGHLNRWSMAMGRPAPDPVGAALHGVDPAATLRLALQLGAVPTNAAMGLEAGLPQPARRSYEFPAFAGIGGRHPGLRQLPKPTPWNIRRFSEAPPPRRAVNKIKHAILRLPWSWEPRDEALLATSAGGRKGTPPPEMQGRIDALTRAMRYPNDTDTWRTVLGQLIEDILVGAFGTLETQEWDNELQPVRMWPVDGMTVRVNIDYAGDDAPDPMQRYRYSQTLAYGGAGMTAPLSLRKFLDRELLYIRYDPRTATPFGLAPTEVAFNMINAWLGVMDARERMESNEVPPFGLDLGEDISREDLMAFRFYWENDIEGMGKIPLLGGHKAPSVLMMRQPARGVALNAWPDLVLRMIAISYHLAPQTFGMERDVNRNCHSEDSQTLTNEGWLTLDELLEDSTLVAKNRRTGAEDRTLRAGLLVAAFDPEQDCLVYQRPDLLHVAPYSGPMVHFSSTKYDFLCTPDHRCWVTTDTGTWGIQPATWALHYKGQVHCRTAPRHGVAACAAPGDAAATFTVPGCASHRPGSPDYPPLTVDLQAWCAWVGFWLSAGSVTAPAGRHYYVSMSQLATSPHLEWMDAVNAAVGLTRYDRPQRTTTFGPMSAAGVRWQVGSKPLALWVRAHMGGRQDDRRIPEFVWNLSQDYKAVVLEALMAGDGCWYAPDGGMVAHQRQARNGYYATMCQALADDVQRLALELGHRAAVVHTAKGHYHVQIALGRTATIVQHITTEEYLGRVYCFDIPPHHLFVSRRNGKVAIHGNTSEVMQSEEFADAVVPVIGLLEDAFTQHFAWKLCSWDDLKFTFNVTAGDPQQQATVANLLYNGDIITLNEAREKAGEDSLPIEDPRGEVFKTEYVAQIQAQYHVAVPFGGGGGGSQQQAQDPNAPGAYGQPTQDQLMQQQQQLADPYGNPYMRLLEELEAPPVQTQIPAPVPQPVVMMQPTGVTVDPVTGTVQWLTSEAQRALAAVAVVAASRATPDGQPVPVPDAQVLEQVRGALARVRGERAA